MNDDPIHYCESLRCGHLLVVGECLDGCPGPMVTLPDDDGSPLTFCNSQCAEVTR